MVCTLSRPVPLLCPSYLLDSCPVRFLAQQYTDPLHHRPDAKWWLVEFFHLGLGLGLVVVVWGKGRWFSVAFHLFDIVLRKGSEGLNGKTEGIESCIHVLPCVCRDLGGGKGGRERRVYSLHRSRQALCAHTQNAHHTTHAYLSCLL